MEERIGKRHQRRTGRGSTVHRRQTIAVGCPFCFTIARDGLTGKKATGEPADSVEVVDVATVLLRSSNPRPSEPRPNRYLDRSLRMLCVS